MTKHLFVRVPFIITADIVQPTQIRKDFIVSYYPLSDRMCRVDTVDQQSFICDMSVDEFEQVLFKRRRSIGRGKEDVNER